MHLYSVCPEDQTPGRPGRRAREWPSGGFGMTTRRFRRLSVLGTTVGAVLAMAAAPAGAGTGAGVASTAATGAAATAGTPAAVQQSSDAPVTGVAAASVGFNLRNARCSSTSVQFDADTYEIGRSGVQRFRQRAQLQEFTAGGWVNRSAPSVVSSVRFANTAASVHFDRHWAASHVNNGASWRVLWQGHYLNGSNVVIAKTRRIAVSCF